jgi:hypothetical protein
MLGLDLSTFTNVHQIISLVGIVTGFIVIRGLTTAKPMDAMTVIFLIATVLTSVTGFMFPFRELLPAHIIGGLSLAALAATIAARYAFHFANGWRAIYAVAVVVSQYFNVFVLVAQMFRQIPALHALAPTEQEPPFIVAQVILLAIFVVLGRRSVKGFQSA